MLVCIVERLKYVLTEGQFHAPWPAVPALFKQRMGKVRYLLSKYVGRAHQLSYDEYLEKVPQHKKKIYKRAVESLMLDPVVKRDAVVKAFPKFEKVVLTEKHPVPRLISPRSPRFNVEFGRYTLAIEKRMYKAINKLFKHTVVCKGHNAVEYATNMRGHWDSIPNPVCVMLDCSRFDQHVGETALRWVWSIYADVFGNDKELLSLIEMLKVNKYIYGNSQGVMKWSDTFRECSGEMDTSLKNTMLMCAMCYAYSSQFKFVTKYYNNGDDMCAFVSADNVQAYTAGISEWFKDMGFKLKVDVTDTFEKIVFCQTQPVFLGDTWICVRQYPACLAKDLACVLSLTNDEAVKAYYGAVADGGLALYGDVPVIGAFYDALKRISEGRTMDTHPTMLLGMRHFADRINRGTNISDVARLSFERAFGLQPCVQMGLEEHFRAYNGHRRVNGVNRWDALVRPVTGML